MPNRTNHIYTYDLFFELRIKWSFVSRERKLFVGMQTSPLIKTFKISRTPSNFLVTLWPCSQNFVCNISNTHLLTRKIRLFQHQMQFNDQVSPEKKQQLPFYHLPDLVRCWSLYLEFFLIPEVHSFMVKLSWSQNFSWKRFQVSKI